MDILDSKEKYTRHNWDEIEFEYIHSEQLPSIRDLAERFGVALSHISSVCKRERWVEKREAYRSNLGAEVLAEAAKEQIDIGLEITRTTLDFLQQWRRQNNFISNADLLKVLELAARANGMELNKGTLVIKDWRDVAAQDGKDADDIQTFADKKAVEYFGLDEQEADENTAGWTD